MWSSFENIKLSLQLTSIPTRDYVSSNADKMNTRIKYIAMNGHRIEKQYNSLLYILFQLGTACDTCYIIFVLPCKLMRCGKLLSVTHQYCPKKKIVFFLPNK